MGLPPAPAGCGCAGVGAALASKQLFVWGACSVSVHAVSGWVARESCIHQRKPTTTRGAVSMLARTMDGHIGVYTATTFIHERRSNALMTPLGECWIESKHRHSTHACQMPTSARCPGAPAVVADYDSPPAPPRQELTGHGMPCCVNQCGTIDRRGGRGAWHLQEHEALGTAPLMYA